MSEAQIWLVDYLKERYQGETVCVEPEYQFCSTRRWRFDVALYGTFRRMGVQLFGFEIEGGIFIQGRHTRGAAYQKDMEKYNTAAAMGWKVFRFTPKQILRGEAEQFLEEHLVCAPRKEHSLA